MGFRKDINGLRALAVVAVLLFHFDGNFLPGGFAGVDIFFVISGYLMTGIIFKGLEGGEFSIRDFICRRLMRIVPALVFLILVLLLFGYFFIIPMDYKEFAEHSISSILFYSNHIFYSEVNYFDELANQKWLLHTWSLSTEWQFYLIWPVLIFYFSKFFSLKETKRLLVISLFLSFLLNIYLSQVNTDMSYYLLPSRIWEMALGGVAFVYPLRGERIKDRVLKVLYGAGLVALFVSFFAVNSKLPWPSIFALLPALGAYCVLLSNRQNQILSNKYCQVIGKYSYSIYLWHWPFLVIILYLKIELPDFIRFVFYVFFTALFSFLSFQFFEKKISLQRSLFLALTGLFLSFVVYLTKGADWRIPNEFAMSAEEYHSIYYGGSKTPVNKVVNLGDLKSEKIEAFFIGDSFAHQYSQFLNSEGIGSKQKYIGLFDHGCMIFRDYTRFANGSEDEECSIEYGKALSTKDSNFESVVIAYNWGRYQSELGLKGEKKKELSEDEYRSVIAEQLLVFQRDFGPRQYYLVGVPQSSKSSTFSCLARRYLSTAKVFPECNSEMEQGSNSFNAFLRDFAVQNVGFIYIDPNQFLCRDGRCKLLSNEGQPIHSDLSHLSVYGAELVGKGILRTML